MILEVCSLRQFCVRSATSWQRPRTMRCARVSSLPLNASSTSDLSSPGELLRLPLALRSKKSALQQNGAQLVDQRCPLADPVSRSMKRLHIELVLAP